ncbi:MAG: 30S ribosome-binding factor RbfA [Verrucomicrobia bacterium]|nr:30S ribosome-binding factor RbfA [Verrucomicrobiota bacterium]
MANKKRTEKLNSLLKEVISEVIAKEVKDPRLGSLVTVTSVDITKDLHHAKVYVSVIGDAESKKKTLDALQSGAGFIAVNSSKKVVMRFFPSLTFKLDDSADKYAAIDTLLGQIRNEQNNRPTTDDAT